MKHSQFALGETFWCGGRQWRCTDTGTRTVVAIRVDAIRTEGGNTELRRTLDRAEAEADGWFNGPPYGVAEVVFDEDDMPACSRD